MKLIVHTDGGARGNPGPAAVGVVIEIYELANDAPVQTIEFGKQIGEATNNVAEYTAVIEALRAISAWQSEHALIKNSSLHIQFLLDSTLVVNQINGIFKVKEPSLRELLLQVHMLEHSVNAQITYMYVPREQNVRADYMVNKALDNR